MAILLVEPDDDLTAMLAFMLQRDGHDVMTARDEPGAYTRAAAKRPSLVITASELSKGSGWSLCPTMHSDLELPVIMLLTESSEDACVRALELGADAFVCKPVSPRLLRAQVKAVLSRAAETGRGVPATSVLRVADLEIDPQWRQVRRGAESVRLTALEFKLLYELAGHQGQVLSHQALVDRVWGFDAVDVGTDADMVKGHIRNLRRKLGASGEQPGYIQTVAGVGYSFRPILGGTERVSAQDTRGRTLVTAG